MKIRYGIDAWPGAHTDDEGNARGADFRMEASEDGRTFSGYAAVFDQPSEDLGGFREVLELGCFKRSLSQRKRDLKAFVNHDWGRLLGTRKADTLELREDGYGLHDTIHLPDTGDGRDVGTLTVRGDIFAQSFAFVPVETHEMDGGKIVRIREAKLFEVSPVTSWPAYAPTTAGVRHLAELLQLDEESIGSAIRALTADEGELTPEQRDLLARAIEARTPKPKEPPASLVALREAFKAKHGLA